MTIFVWQNVLYFLDAPRRYIRETIPDDDASMANPFASKKNNFVFVRFYMFAYLLPFCSEVVKFF